MIRALHRCRLNAAMILVAALALLAPSARAGEPIRIGVVRSMGGSPSIIAKEKGFFAAEGLDAELTLFDSAQPIAVAVASGDCQFGATGMTAAFFNLASQGVLRILGAGTWEHAKFHSVGMVVSNQAHAAGLRAFKDLGGHSIGITQLGSPLQYFALQIAEKYGIDGKSLRFLALQSNGNVASSIAGNQVDAAVQTAAPISAIVEKGDGKLLGWTADELPPRQGEAVFTATAVANARPETVKHFMAALRRADRHLHDAFVDEKGQRREGAAAEEALTIVAKYLDQPLAAIRPGMPYFDPEARTAVKDIAALMAWYKAQGMMKGDATAEALIDRRYAIEMPAK